MKKIGIIVAALALCISCIGGLWQQPAQATAADQKLGEYGFMLDLNNSDVRDFRKFPGFYPTLSSKIINNAPYNTVEEVLDIPGLSASQKKRLQAYMDYFTVTKPSDIFNQEANRFNVGIY